MSNKDNEELYTLTMWGCLYAVLQDYNIDVDHVTGKMGEHIVEDFMELLEKCGYVGRISDDDGK